ncbi:SixA phosphatase family protein [Trueperella bialowiezensis]|nr:histidine phosphatase family protein [Trueperella bialowiezensis]
MNTLIVMRHAKAADGSPDHRRPLADRGRRQASYIGGQLASRFPVIDQLFVSDAVRTQQTLEQLVAGGLKADAVNIDPRLYSAGGDDLVEIIRTEATGQTVMIVGHEPTMSALAFELWDRQGSAGFESGFPTAGTAVFTCARPWLEMPTGGLALKDFLTAPRLPS